MSRLVASPAAIFGVVEVAGSLAAGSYSTRLCFDEDSIFSLALNSVCNCFTSDDLSNGILYNAIGEKLRAERGGWVGNL